ncbi:isopenicillin N synthase family dioxygenase [Actinospica sp.]|uniref:isopenicillin N synthase family dioxygenase n=1 Tax=Actinospica sp. TaxID=1872142 RepID=UPI002C94319F|nr:2-oxoglutarate and iron-dependent oxygenase domain-containing protein [Actinospica sp.]HWG27619.1 2-oxoglutarate and iron-dependent oxygenase domain-containing protein [Actinospica sp.]
MIPLIDLNRWRAGDREAVAAETDAALQESGFLMVSGHGVSVELRAEVRAAAKRFFALPAERKLPYTAPVSGRGWIPIGKEANAFYGVEADAARADLKESYTIGREHRTGDPALDEAWFKPNVWPDEVPELAGLCAEYAQAVRALNEELLRICAVALGLDEDWLVVRSRNSPHTFNVNRYPPLSETGVPLDGQFRVGPHTDWGMLTILDRQVGYGGLQIQTLDGAWIDAPHVENAFTINVGDLLERWTGNRWRSTRHRVLPPPRQSPGEELISLIVFLEADFDLEITTLPAPISRRQDYPPVRTADFYLERSEAATVN